jgi:hypothetical protein
MKIVVNHLTRMHGGHICVAGLDLETHQQIRPVLGDQHLPFYFLARYGGPFDMARIVELGAARPTPDPPHVEDHVFVASRAKVYRRAFSHEFWGLLESQARSRLREIFGDALRPVGRSRYGTDVGRGQASLGFLRVARPPELYLAVNRDGKPQIRMNLSDGEIGGGRGRDRPPPVRPKSHHPRPRSGSGRGQEDLRFRSGDSQPGAHPKVPTFAAGRVCSLPPGEQHSSEGGTHVAVGVALDASLRRSADAEGSGATDCGRADR